MDSKIKNHVIGAALLCSLTLPACTEPAPLIVSAPETSWARVDGGREATVAARIHDRDKGHTVDRVAKVYIADQLGARSDKMDVIAHTTNEAGETLTYQHNLANKRMVIQTTGGSDVEVEKRRDENLVYKNNIYADTSEMHLVIAQDANKDLGPIDPYSIAIMGAADEVISEEMDVRAAALPFAIPIIQALAQLGGAIYNVVKSNDTPAGPGAA